MDRLLKVYGKRGYLFAALEFSYDKRRQVAVKYVQHRMYESEDPDTGEISLHTYEMRSETDRYHNFRELLTIEDAKKHDIDYVKQHFGHDMTDPAGYDFIYETEPVLRRYIISDSRNCIGVADIRFTFTEDKKEMSYLSATQFIDDMVVAGSSLTTNHDLIQSLPMTDRWGEPWRFDAESTTKVDSWINR